MNTTVNELQKERKVLKERIKDLQIKIDEN